MRLFDYIKGNRRGKEAHRLEKEAMGDPFLWEALEGFDAVEGNHTEAIERLSRRITERAVTRRSKRWIWIASGAAAVLLLFLTIGGRFLFQEQSEEQIVPYMAEAIETEKDTADTSNVQSPMELAQAQEAEQQDYPEIVESQMIEPQGDISAFADINREEAVSVEELAFTPAAVAEPEPVPVQAERIVTRGTATTEPLSMAKADVRQQQAAGGVYGQVVDSQGEPIPGASVQVRGTTNGVTTDVDGNFQLNTQANDILDITFLGYNQASVRASSLPGRVVLKESTDQLDEVVVTGFGSERRARMDAPTASISASERLADRIAGTSSGSAPDGEPVGGMEAFKKYIEENKPELYYNSGNPVRGTIILEFRVNRNGRPTGIRVEKGLLSTANDAAKRLLEEGPDWKPANGRVQVKIEF